jgi:NADH-quinone oxidoreductase subunit J
MESLLFYGFSAAAVLGAVLVITLPKPAHALLALVGVMFALAVLFLLLEAPFVAMAHLIVYAGAILVLFLFVIMLEGAGAKDTPLGQRFRKSYLTLATFVAAAFLVTMLFLMIKVALPSPQGVQGTVEAFGRTLFKHYWLPFELTSLLLLLGVFAAIALAKKEPAS